MARFAVDDEKPLRPPKPAPKKSDTPKAAPVTAGAGDPKQAAKPKPKKEKGFERN